MGLCGNSPRKSDRKENADITTKADGTSCHYEKNVPANTGKKKYSACNEIETRGAQRFSETKIRHIQVTDDDLTAAEEYVQRFLQQMIGHSDSRVYDFIRKYGSVGAIEAGQLVLKKGGKSRGLFIIIKGEVEVVTSDNEMAIRILYAGDIFGDLSTVFGIPCTANVVTKSFVNVVILNESAVETLFEDVQNAIDLTAWCLKRRYLPTSDALDYGRVYRRTAFQALRTLPLFSDWPDNLLKVLILSLDDVLVTLYPVNSILILEGDPMDSLMVIIHGNIELQQGSLITKYINIKSWDEPFVFGMSGLFSAVACSPITIKAMSNTQVLKVANGLFTSTIEEHPDIQQSMLKKQKEFEEFSVQTIGLEPEIAAATQFELLYHDLRESAKYKTKERSELEAKLKHGVFEIMAENDTIEPLDEIECEAVLLIHGVLKEMTGNGKATARASKETFLAKLTEDVADINNEMGVLFASIPSFGESLKYRDGPTYKAGEVIDLARALTMGHSFTAATKCCIVKLALDGHTVEKPIGDPLYPLRLV